MNRQVEKLFGQLAENGMVRAYLRVEEEEYIFPLIGSGGRKKKRWMWIAAAGLLLALLIAVALRVTTPAPLPDNGRVQPPRADRFGMTALHHAVLAGKPGDLAVLLKNKNLLEAQDLYGWTALHWAVFKGDKKKCALLIDHGASVTVASTAPWFRFPSGTTPAKMAEMLDRNELLAAPTSKKGDAVERAVGGMRKK